MITGDSACPLSPVPAHPWSCATEASPLRLPQHADQHRLERPVLLEVDQELGEGAGLRVAPVGLDRAHALEVGERQDVETARRQEPSEGVEALTEAALELVGAHPTKGSLMP
jgi:hypothetical protein